MTDTPYPPEWIDSQPVEDWFEPWRTDHRLRADALDVAASWVSRDPFCPGDWHTLIRRYDGRLPELVVALLDIVAAQTDRRPDRGLAVRRFRSEATDARQTAIERTD